MKVNNKNDKKKNLQALTDQNYLWWTQQQNWNHAVSSEIKNKENNRNTVNWGRNWFNKFWKCYMSWYCKKFKPEEWKLQTNEKLRVLVDIIKDSCVINCNCSLEDNEIYENNSIHQKMIINKQLKLQKME